MDATTILIVAALAWLSLRIRDLEARAVIAEVRASSAERAANTERAGRVVAELRALALEVEVMSMRQAARDLDGALRDGASAQVAALPHMRTDATDRIPGLVRQLVGDGGSDGRSSG
jgi:hypothetical protein